MSNGNFSSFLESLGAFESGITIGGQVYPDYYYEYTLGLFDSNKGNLDRNSVDLSNPADQTMAQYHVHNTLGFMGKYQFGEPLLIDLGYYSPAPGGYYGSTATNEWQGTWTGKNGVNSKEDFMTEVQELAIREAFAMNMKIIETRLEQAGKSLDDFLGQTFTYTQGGVESTAVVTMSGILASAHLQGPGGVANLLLNGVASSDEYGTNILSYMDKFGDFTVPFGAGGDELLSGSDYSETFAGGAGHNVYETGDGYDKIIITENEGGSDTIKDFDVNKDVLSLSDFDGLKFSDLLISSTPEGYALITLPNNQTIILEGVNANQVTEDLFVQGPIVLGWAVNSGDNFIENFNLRHDQIDFNYAFGLNNLLVYEENGSTVIDILGNNQRYVIEGIALDDLTAGNFIKAPPGFIEQFFGDNVSYTPPDNATPPADNTTVPDVTDNASGNDVVQPDGDIYSFTWNWNSHDVINNFDVNDNAIDLQNFWTSFDAIDLYDNAEGNAVIDLMNLNQQTITLNGVPADQLSAQNFIGVSGNFADLNGGDDVIVTTPPVVDDAPTTDTPNNVAESLTFTWAWGGRDVVENFDPDHDALNLQSFWTNYDNIKLYDNLDGNAVVDLMDLNNQTITLNGVSVADLSASNITGVTGLFGNALIDGGEADDLVDMTASDVSDTADFTDGDTYSYTWNWGSHDVIAAFDVNNDSIDLHNFWTSPDDVDIYDDGQGNAVIDLTALNNQTITVQNTSATDLDGHVTF